MHKRINKKKKNINCFFESLLDKFLEWSFKNKAKHINKALNGK